MNAISSRINKAQSNVQTVANNAQTAIAQQNASAIAQLDALRDSGKITGKQYSERIMALYAQGLGR